MEKGFIHITIVVFLIFITSSEAIAQNKKDQQRGVIIYDSARCMNGLNSVSGAQYVDMHGNIVKTRKAQLGIDIDANRYVGISDHEKYSLFNHDTIVWTVEGTPHHVAFLTEDGKISALGYEEHTDSKRGRLSYEMLGTLDLDGKIVKTESFYPLADQIQKYLPESRERIIKRNKEFVIKYVPTRVEIFDSFFFHINSVQIIPPNASEKKDTVFKHGNLLISDFTNNFMAIVDRDDLHILWFYYQAESMLGQHSAQMLSDGRIIYFLNNLKDNKTDTYHSAVRILNPISRKVEWEYTGTPAHTLYSITQGACQHLKNGNILITVNNAAINGEGYVEEVTPSKEIVWKWIPVNYKALLQLEEGFTYVHRIEK